MTDVNTDTLIALRQELEAVVDGVSSETYPSLVSLSSEGIEVIDDILRARVSGETEDVDFERSLFTVVSELNTVAVPGCPAESNIRAAYDIVTHAYPQAA